MDWINEIIDEKTNQLDMNVFNGDEVKEIYPFCVTLDACYFLPDSFLRGVLVLSVEFPKQFFHNFLFNS